MAVAISDSLGHHCREGSEGAAIGLAGIAAVQKAGPDDVDRYGNPMGRHQPGRRAGRRRLRTDGQSNAARPVVLMRGAAYTPAETTSIRDRAGRRLLPARRGETVFGAEPLHHLAGVVEPDAVEGAVQLVEFGGDVFG